MPPDATGHDSALLVPLNFSGYSDAHLTTLTNPNKTRTPNRKRKEVIQDKRAMSSKAH